VRLDDTAIDGLRPTVGYFDTRRLGIDALVRALTAKLAGRSGSPDGWPGDRVPRNPRETAQMLAERPPGWEYLYFAGALHSEVAALESRYLDHELQYAAPSGERVEDYEAVSYLQRAIDDVRALVDSLTSMMEPSVQERAFGAPGEPGDANRIRHLAMRWNAVYEGLIDWAARLRGMSTTEAFRRPFAVLARFADRPMQEYRDFVAEIVRQMDRVPELLAANEPANIALTLTLTVDEELAAKFSEELARLAAGLPADAN